MKDKIIEIIKKIDTNNFKQLKTNFYHICKDHSIITKINELSSRFDITFIAALYMIINDMTDIPICIDCHIKHTKFKNFQEGFKERCPTCNSKFSGKESQRKRSSNPKIMRLISEKLKLSEKHKREKRELEKQSYVYIELSEANIKKAQDEAELAYSKGYIKDKMDNLLLNKLRNEFPILMEVIKSMRHENKVRNNVEGLYFLYHKLNEKPHCSLHLDDKCTDIVTFIDFGKGYNEACGNCSKHKPGSTHKACDTYFKKTGFHNPASNPEVMKLRGDNFEKKHGPGIRHHMQTQEGRQKVIDKILGKTGGKYSYIVQSPEVRDKAVMSIFEKHDEIQKKTEIAYLLNHGVKRYQSTDKFKKQARLAIEKNPQHYKKIIDSINDLKELFGVDILEFPKFMKDDVKYRCDVCNHEGITSITKFKSGNIWICPVCHPYKGGQSKGEYDVSCIIKKYLPEEVFEFSNKKILNGKEIDIFYPDKKIAIEYCGAKYHSSHLANEWKYGTLEVSEDYHYQKWLGCKNKGIDLITIFDDEWNIKFYRKIAIKSLLYKFDIYKNIVKIEDCQIIKIHDSKIIYNFLRNNCLDRFNDYNEAYCIMYKNTIISMFCFNDKENHYDIRYCNDKDYRILDGFSVLLKKFQFEYPHKDILYSVNRNWMDIPFDIEQYDFSVYNDEMNLNRFYWGSSLYKRKMIQDFNDENKEMLKSERLSWLYDCGNVIYKL